MCSLRVYEFCVYHLLITSAALSALGPNLRAQEMPDLGAAQPVEEKESPQPHNEGVYLNDSFEAYELIEQARRSAAQRDWSEAIKKLQQARQKYGEKVLDAKNGTYISVTAFLNRKISGWPVEGLAVYREQYEPRASQALEDMGQNVDAELLTKTFDDFFCTSSAARAGDMLAQFYLECGNFSRAQAIYEQLLSTHPDRSTRGQDWTAKLAISQALAGQFEKARLLLEESGPSLTQYSLQWKGHTTSIQSVLKEIAANPLASHEPTPTKDWPTFGGNASRTFVSSSNVVPTAPLWSFDDFSGAAPAKSDSYFQSSSYRNAYIRGRFLVLQPIVANEIIFFNDSLRVWAISQETGSQVWSYEGTPAAGESSGWGDRSIPSLHSCTFFGGRLYADLGRHTVSYYGYQPPRTYSVVVCLDAATGKELWKVRPQEFGEDPREVAFEGPILANDSGVYVIARRRKAFGFEDCYLWKFDHSGAFKWRTHLASASTGGFGYRRPTLAIPTLIDSTVFVQTNLGAIAAVDTLRGLVTWISIYSKAKAGTADKWQQARSGEIYPWQYNPMLPLPNDQILACPLDSAELLILDRRTGLIKTRLPKSRMNDVQSFLGIVDGAVYGVGHALFCWDCRSGEMAWTRALPDSPLYGRGALSRTHIYVPCRDGMYTFPIDGGDPIVKQWDHPAEGGNVVVLPEYLLVAGNERISSYGMRDDVFARLQKRMDQSPSNPIAALDMAEVAYRTAFSHPPGSDKDADYSRGREALAEAIRRAGGFASAWDESVRIRLFRDCMEFADLRLREDPPTIDEGIELLVMAGLCPPDSASSLLQKSTLASAYALRRDHVNELLQYHQVMSDRSLRELHWPALDSKSLSSQEVCRQRIAALIDQHGREIYQSLDEKADTLLAAAAQADDVQRLDRIITTLPNSLAAPKALLAKGALLRDKMNQPIRAARNYYAALTRYAHSVDPAETIRQLADCYVRAEEPAAAWQWLTKASREHPGAKVSLDGRVMTFLEYRALLGNVDSDLEGPFPLMEAQLHDEFEFDFQDEDQILYPEFPNLAKTDWSRLIVYEDGAVMAYQAAKGETSWLEPVDCKYPPRLLASLKHVIVLVTRFELLGIDPESGKIIWRHGGIPEKISDPASDPEQFPVWRLHRLKNDLLVSSRDDGQTVCIEIDDGRIVWNTRLEHHPNQALSVGRHLVIYRATTTERQIFPVLSIRDGKLQRIIELEEDNPVLEIVETLAGNVMFVTSQSLIAVDPITGQTEWQVRFDHNFLQESVHVVLDGIILSADGLHVTKLSLDDGREVWKSETLSGRPTDFRLFAPADELYLAGTRKIVSIDRVSGRTLGVIEVPHNSQLETLQVTKGRLAFICRSLSLEGTHSDFFTVFEDRPAHADRVLDRANAQQLGRHSNTMRFYGYDGAIIGVEANALHGWTNPSNSSD